LIIIFQFDLPFVYGPLLLNITLNNNIVYLLICINQMKCWQLKNC
jgi:hypothetical protein